MPTLECSGGMQPSGCKTADGRLWFPTSKGLVVFNPNDVKANLMPPSVIIEELRVDDKIQIPEIEPTGAEWPGEGPGQRP